MKQSIISVDNDDVDLDLRDMKLDEEGNRVEGNEKDKQSLTFVEYKKMVNRIVRYIRSEETVDDPAMRQGDVEDWTLDSYSDEIEEAEIVPFMNKVQMVIERLIHCDRILLVHTEAAENKDRLIEVHPNYDLEADISKIAKDREQELKEDTEKERKRKEREEIKRQQAAAEAGGEEAMQEVES